MVELFQAVLCPTQSYTALPMKTDFHFQPILQHNFKQTSIQLFFVSPQSVHNVVALTHFFQHVPHMSLVDLYKGQVSLTSR